MSGEDAFQVEGVILKPLSERTCRVRLANGHQLLGFVTRRSLEQVGRLTEGRRMILQLKPFDLSKGRIVEAAESERQ